MNGQSIAGLMVRETTRRHLTEAPHEPRPRRSRRTAARALQALAHRLDAGVAPAPRVNLGR
jgi:hypothetical protein